jgi:hypothetical protein
MAAEGSAVMLVDLIGGKYYTLNETGGRVWQLLVDGESPSTIAQRLAKDYGIDVRQCEVDTRVLLDRLAEYRLIGV